MNILLLFLTEHLVFPGSEKLSNISVSFKSFHLLCACDTDYEVLKNYGKLCESFSSEDFNSILFDFL